MRERTKLFLEASKPTWLLVGGMAGTAMAMLPLMSYCATRYNSVFHWGNMAIALGSTAVMATILGLTAAFIEMRREAEEPLKPWQRRSLLLIGQLLFIATFLFVAVPFGITAMVPAP